jgi:microcystin-dependent protein
MALCSPRSCGCAIQSDSLSITGSGTPEDPLQIEFGLPLPAELLEVLTPAGSIRATPYATADAGWLLFGASYPNANAAYPTLWGKVPAAWKSGTTLVLPTDDEMVLRGNTAGIGAVSGSNTRTLVEANLPPHVHNMIHAHSASSGTVSADHGHSYSGGTGGRSAAHTHTMTVPVFVHDPFAPGFNININNPGGTLPANYYQAETGTESADHGHGFSGGTGGINTNHVHGITVDAHVGTTGSAGSSTALNIQEAGINVRFQIKAH